MKRSESYENPGKLVTGRGKSKYKGPGVGMSLVCSRSKRKPSG